MEKLTPWLIGTIPGILCTGVLASLLAIPIGRLLRWFLLRAALRVLLMHVRPYITARILTRKYSREGNYQKLVTFIVVTAAFSAAQTVLVLACAIGLALYLFAFGLGNPSFVAVLVAVQGLLLAFWLRDLFGLAGVVEELLIEDLRWVRSLLKRPNDVRAHFEELNHEQAGAPAPLAAPQVTPQDDEPSEILAEPRANRFE